jgi:hypothetical protein
MRTLLAVLAIALVGLCATATARADEPKYSIPANVNDPAISTTRGPNLVWLAPAAQRVGKLLVFLPSGGANNFPTEFKWVGTEGGRLGYHTIVLAYRNEVGINAAPPLGCGPDIDPPPNPPDCALNVHKELFDGGGQSPLVNVDRANSIENRLIKVLQHLAATHADEGWSQFLDAGAPKWSETVIAGQSLGAGEAFLIAQERALHRVAAFSGWTDAKHGWIQPGLTPKGRYFGQVHARENFYARTCFAYLAMGLTPGCPLAGPTVDDRLPPFGPGPLVFNLEPATGPTVINDPYHSSSARDGWIAKAADGVTPSPRLLNNWRSILGDSDADTRLDQVDNCPLVANAEQVDSDANGTGDACAPTFASGTVGGAVPATLALTLGAPATFGAFVPGITRTYDATSTASVVSTAGDAALTTSDPGHLTNGTFSLPEPLRVELTPASWTGPVSNAAVSVAFKQLVKSTDALRTGTYSKVLTFTLSTTTP